jgi:hypothetical protein
VPIQIAPVPHGNDDEEIVTEKMLQSRNGIIALRWNG